MTSLFTAILLLLSSLGMPGLEDSCLDPADPAPCSAAETPSDGSGQAWGSNSVPGPDPHKISNGF
jgi:hypothetical protein